MKNRFDYRRSSDGSETTETETELVDDFEEFSLVEKNAKEGHVSECEQHPWRKDVKTNRKHYVVFCTNFLWKRFFWVCLLVAFVMMGGTGSFAGPSVLSVKDKVSRRLPRVVITGLAKDIAKHLPHVRKALLKATDGIFDVVRVVIFENDSKDNTREVLSQWNESWPLDILGENGMEGGRTRKLAIARNAVLQHLRDHMSEEFDYVLNVDLDEVNYEIHGIDECFNLPAGWAACCTNNYRQYYDLFALRTKDDWCDCDVFTECFPPCQEGETGLKGLKECEAKHQKERKKKKIHIPASRAPIEVDSCFGGAALYDYSLLEKLPRKPYKGRRRVDNKNVKVCEHVSFNEYLRELGGKIWIQPKFLNRGALVKGGDRDIEIRFDMQDPLQSKYYEGFPTRLSVNSKPQK